MKSKIILTLIFYAMFAEISNSTTSTATLNELCNSAEPGNSIFDSSKCTSLKGDKGYKCCQKINEDIGEIDCVALKTVEINKILAENDLNIDSKIKYVCSPVPHANSTAFDEIGEVRPFTDFRNFSMSCVDQIPRENIPYDCTTYQYKGINKHWCCFVKGKLSQIVPYCSYYTDLAKNITTSSNNMFYEFTCWSSYIRSLTFSGLLSLLLYIFFIN